MEETEFFRIEPHFLGFPIIWQAESNLEKALICFTSLHTLVHELGHALVGKYYAKINTKKIVIQSNGGYTQFDHEDYVRLFHEKALSNQDLAKKILDLSKEDSSITSDEIPDKSTQFIDLYYETISSPFECGLKTAAGPIVSACFHTLGLAYLSTVTHKFSLIDKVHFIFHSYGMLHEVLYALTYSGEEHKEKGEGDWGNLAKFHPKIQHVATQILSILSCICLHSAYRCLSKK